MGAIRVTGSGAEMPREPGVQARPHELALLHDATRIFSSALSVEQIEREVVGTAARLVAAPDEAPRRAVFLRVEDGFATVVQEDDASGLSHAGFRFPVGAHALVQAALLERRAVTAPLAELEPGTPALRQAMGEVTASDAAYAPVFVQDEPFGVVVVTVEDGRGFSIDQLRRLEAIASLAELAIANGRHFEAVRREGERMAALEEVKSKFLRLASHELRGPLAVLRGYVSMLRDGTFTDSPEQLPEIYSILDAKAGQMELLVTQMLEAARLEEGRLRMDMRRIDVRKPVRAAFEDVRLVARRTHDMTLDAPPDKVEVVADAGRITTIVANLLDNAVKYSPGGGPVHCTVRPEADRALIEVSDRGLGIALADMATLFTRFGRIETVQNRNIQGTGLGLYLSRELAQMQGATLTAASDQGQGSTFTLAVPLAP